MPSLFSNLDRSSWVYQGNFSRSRARYRGSRESHKFNLQVDQLLYDLKKLYETFDALDALYGDYQSQIENGISFSASYPSAEAYPSAFVFPGTSSSLIIFGLYDLNIRIDKLYRRIHALEA